MRFMAIQQPGWFGVKERAVRALPSSSSSSSSSSCAWCRLPARRVSRNGTVVARGLPSVERPSGVPVQREVTQRVEGKFEQPPRVIKRTKSHLQYEIIKGPLVEFSDSSASTSIPTAVLVHGILGSGRNLRAFARRLARENPAWQFLLVDLRCHGESAGDFEPAESCSDHSVESAAADILRLLQMKGMWPNMLIGHSFGGKVCMKMTEAWGGKVLPRPVQVWVLDTVPSADVRAAEHGADHPGELIEFLRNIPLPITSPSSLVEDLRETGGFSFEVAAWVATNLTVHASGKGYDWIFDLEGIKQMYESYVTSDLWSVIERPPQGLSIDFVRAERSTFRWAGADHHRIETNGAQVHMLEDAGHWVHSDNPEGLVKIMKQSFSSN
eukprot:CAMPEP_0197477160 /NCGR_PEP_ID=MMETSP1309-20131121/14339_1 /TAXON_ID=464262 /ORGANISM="Genus nov. species nov., Strain RCC998" /LENGTH=382 /DNA_ID=CAMNT_0043017963 /DNA_START=182 /DNA_END=1330 /DNA_ORIENTATION=-